MLTEVGPSGRVLSEFVRGSWLSVICHR